MKARRLRNFLFVLLGALVITLGISLFTSATAVVSFRYVVTDLNPPGSVYRYTPLSINNLGQVVGYVDDLLRQAFLWDKGTIKILPTSGIFPSASSINNRGQIVGTEMDNNANGYRPVLWENNTQKVLGKGNMDFANHINDKGQVVGSSESFPWYSQRASLWEQGRMKVLRGFVGRYGNAANSINNSGQIVGYSDTDAISGTEHACLWENGTVKDLGTLGGSESFAHDINNRGQVVGASDTSTSSNSNKLHAFLWEQGRMKDLHTLGSVSVAYSVNNRGRVVGYTYINNSRAFLWTNGRMIDLNELIPHDSGWILTSAQDINDKGQIVGEGVLNGTSHGFLLTPTWVIR
jgi:probable HAF family extracellular repeat protein